MNTVYFSICNHSEFKMKNIIKNKDGHNIIMILFFSGKFSLLLIEWGFPGSSEGKESSCNARDPGSIPESGKSPGEGNSYPLQYCCLGNPWTEEPGGLVHRVSRVGHNGAGLKFKKQNC